MIVLITLSLSLFVYIPFYASTAREREREKGALLHILHIYIYIYRTTSRSIVCSSSRFNEISNFICGDEAPRFSIHNNTIYMYETFCVHFLLHACMHISKSCTYKYIDTRLNGGSRPSGGPFDHWMETWNLFYQTSPCPHNTLYLIILCVCLCVCVDTKYSWFYNSYN